MDYAIIVEISECDSDLSSIKLHYLFWEPLFMEKVVV